MWSEKFFLSCVKEFLGCNLQGTATCRFQVPLGKAGLKPDHKLHLYKHVLWNIHEWPWHMIPIPAALVCPKTCDTVAEDTCNIARNLSIDIIYHKCGVFRQSWSRHVRESPNLFKCEVRSSSFLVSKSFLDAICRAQPRAGSKCLWERLVWNQITSCTFTSTYCGTFMNDPGIWFPSQQHWTVPRHVTLWQKMLVTSPVTFPLTVLTISEEYSGSLEADMSENHPTSSSVKWEVLPFLCQRVSWMQSAGRSNVQVASVSWERLLWNQITRCTFTNTYRRTFMNHPGIWFPSQQHWSVPRHMTLWQKMLPTLAVGFRLTVLTISEEYSGSLEADMSENHPTSSSVKWEVLLSLCVILCWMQSAGRSNVQVASVSWERLLWNQITSCTFTSKYWRTFMHHPGIWFPSQHHWSVPRHVTLWQKMPVTSPVTFPLTLLTTSEEDSGSFEAAMSENHPTSSSVKWVLLSLCVILSWMQFAGHSHVQVASVNEKGSFENQITSCTLTSRYVLVPDTWDRFKQIIANHLSIDPTHNKWGILRQSWSSHVREPPNFFQCEVRRAPFLVCSPFLDAMCRAQQIAGCKCCVGKACLTPDRKLHLYKHVLWNIHESTWHMIPIPAALVCPKTCDTVAEDSCNIDRHHSIDLIYHKKGIFRRQSWSRHVREPPNFFKCEVRSAPLLVCNPLLNAMCRAQQIAGCKCIWERLLWNQITSCTFTNTYWRTFMNHPGVWFLSQ